MWKINPNYLAARCNYLGLSHVSASKMEDIKCEDHRHEPGWSMDETDWSFTQNRRRYIVRQEIAGDKRYSARYRYFVEIVQ